MGILKSKKQGKQQPKSKIVNEPRIKFGLLDAIREQLEHRALWMYVLNTEAKAHGYEPSEWAADAIRRCGEYQGGILREKGGEGESFVGLKKALFGFFAQLVFEMKIKRVDADHLDIDFHYCPLVKAWQKQGASDEEIAQLCDFAMCGDRGIISRFGGELDLQSSIAHGDPYCKIRFKRTDCGGCTGCKDKK